MNNNLSCENSSSEPAGGAPEETPLRLFRHLILFYGAGIAPGILLAITAVSSLSATAA